MGDNDKGTSSAKLISSLLALAIILILESKGYRKLDIPNYPIKVDAPKIYDGDENVTVSDFSIITTYDGKEHLCYELYTDGKTEYYDVSTKSVIDFLSIKEIKHFEDDVKGQVRIIYKGLGDPKQLKSVVEAELEEHHVKTLIPPKQN